MANTRRGFIGLLLFGAAAPKVAAKSVLSWFRPAPPTKRFWSLEDVDFAEMELKLAALGIDPKFVSGDVWFNTVSEKTLRREGDQWVIEGTVTQQVPFSNRLTLVKTN